MRIWFLALLLAALLIESPASADVTARYRDQNGSAIIIQVSDSGDSRVEVNDAAYLKAGGVGYLVVDEARGGFVVRLEDFTGVMEGLVGVTGPAASPTAPPVEVHETGTEQVAGRTGRVFRIGSGEDSVDAVVSPDEDLAPLGRALNFHFGPMIRAMSPNMREVGEAIIGVLDRGALLRLGAMWRLESLDRAPLPASLFTLPSAPISRDELIERLGAPRPGQ